MNLKDSLLHHLKDKKFRDTFASEQLDKMLSKQIRALRRQRGWTQQELAVKAGMSQTRIAQLENPRIPFDHLGPLRKLAAVFDVALVVRFISWGEFLDLVISFKGVEIIPSYPDDRVMHT
jgi:transcriptional regulator with XRE-family HTH domain